MVVQDGPGQEAEREFPLSDSRGEEVYRVEDLGFRDMDVYGKVFVRGRSVGEGR